MDVLDQASAHLDRRRFTVQRVSGPGRWSYPLHRHLGFAEVFYISAGSMEHEVDGRVVGLGPGALVLVREQDAHRLAGRDVSYTNLNLHLDDLRRVVAYLDDGARLGRLLADRQAPPAVTVPPGERHELEDLLARLFACQGAPGADALFQRGLLALLAPFVRAPVAAAAADARPAWLDQALEEAVANLAEATPAWLAKRAGVSPAHLARSLRRHCGTTPSAWLNRCRLERAALRLSHTNQPIPAICFDLGFAHLGWFYRVFRRAHGCPPGEYRQRYGTVAGR